MVPVKGLLSITRCAKSSRRLFHVLPSFFAKCCLCLTTALQFMLLTWEKCRPTVVVGCIPKLLIQKACQTGSFCCMWMHNLFRNHCKGMCHLAQSDTDLFLISSLLPLPSASEARSWLSGRRTHVDPSMILSAPSTC